MTLRQHARAWLRRPEPRRHISIGIFNKPSQSVIVSNFPTTKSLLTIVPRAAPTIAEGTVILQLK
jgi:hypothetical protein